MKTLQKEALIKQCLFVKLFIINETILYIAKLTHVRISNAIGKRQSYIIVFTKAKVSSEKKPNNKMLIENIKN